MAEMKGIKVCGECANYDWKKHRCGIGCLDDSDAQASFYGDCPLPDVVPKCEVIDDHHKQVACYTLGCREGDKIKREVAREIFEEIEKIAMHGVTPLGLCLMSMGEAAFAKLKKKYMEDE